MTTTSLCAVLPCLDVIMKITPYTFGSALLFQCVCCPTLARDLSCEHCPWHPCTPPLLLVTVWVSPTLIFLALCHVVIYSLKSLVPVRRDGACLYSQRLGGCCRKIKAWKSLLQVWGQLEWSWLKQTNKQQKWKPWFLLERTVCCQNLVLTRLGGAYL